jgi:hypothetical protein
LLREGFVVLAILAGRQRQIGRNGLDRPVQDEVRMTKERNTLTGAVVVFGLLLTLYALTFNGLFTSIDELALYAKTENLVQEGSLETPQLAFAAYHNPVGEEEPGFSLVAAPFYWFSQQFSRLNNIHVVMLLNPLVTAATAALVYATTRALGYSQAGSAVGALAFGLTTLAWPYARTLYREPLAALGWSLGLLCLVLWRLRGRVALVAVGGIVLALTLAVKATAIAGIPFIFLAGLKPIQGRRRLGRLAIVVTIAAVALAFLFLVIVVRRYDSLVMLHAISRWTPMIGLKRTYGQLLSPGKGLVFYMPVVMLVIPGLVSMGRRHRAVALAAALPVLTTAVAYSSYNSWFGGQSWGPRFLVPAVPLLTLGIAPLWDSARKRWLRILFLVILILSMVIQLGVVTANWWPGYKPLFDSGPSPEDNAGLQPAKLALSPPLVQLRTWSTDALDLLWFHPDLSGNTFLSPPLALGLIAAVTAASASWWLVWRRGWPGRISLLPPAAALIIVVWWGPEATPGYPGLPAEQGQALARRAGGEGNVPYTLITVSNEFHIYFYLGFLKGDFVHHWLSPNQTEGFEPVLARDAAERLVLVIDRVHMDPQYSGKELEWWLNEQLFRVQTEWVGSYELVYYANIQADDWPWKDVSHTFGNSFSVTGFAASQDKLEQGDMLGLQIRICRIGPAPEYHHLFLHLQAPGRQISGHDGPIRYGGTEAVSWELGDCLVERRAIAIPAEAEAGWYDLIIGFDTPDGPLTVDEEQAGTRTGTFAALGQMTVMLDDPAR